MRHNRKVKKLGRKKAHRIATIRNLLRGLILHGEIKTTIAKAKACRDQANRLIAKATKDSLATRRYLFRHLNDHRLVKRLCVEIAPQLADHRGGYVRIYRLGRRDGDGAEMALLSLVEPIAEEEKKGK
ncbi:50S ribosomal protein L17 [candidate division WOR-3 bacterium]|uniref:50S ribosomal protein L17 n=1 Tax=candidate division WOR-3 bacterium TaxID=2052148 RepID=A0A660SEQ3_UNCW3|nr:MAG: 50S ribosomal protein L17 [candidate division WOR-3 bacterium]